MDVISQKGNPFQRIWYLIKHDDLLKIQRKRHGNAPQWIHPIKGEYWSEEVGERLSVILKKYEINHIKK